MLLNIFKKTPQEQEKFISEVRKLHDKLDALIAEIDAKNHAHEQKLDTLHLDIQERFAKSLHVTPPNKVGRPRKRL